MYLFGKRPKLSFSMFPILFLLMAISTGGASSALLPVELVILTHGTVAFLIKNNIMESFDRPEGKEKNTISL